MPFGRVLSVAFSAQTTLSLVRVVQVTTGQKDVSEITSRVAYHFFEHVVFDTHLQTTRRVPNSSMPSSMSFGRRRRAPMLFKVS